MKMKMNKKIVIITSASLLLLAALIAGLEYYGVIDFIPNNGPTPLQQAQQKKTEQEQKKDFVESTDEQGRSKDQESESGTVSPPTSPDSIELSAKKNSSSEVTIFTKLHGYSAGTCELSIRNSSKNYTKSAPIIYQETYSICAGFSVPTDQLGSGNWEITLRVTPTGSSPISKTISYGVN